MLNREMMVNIALFMERVTDMKGKEALAWSETYQAVVAAINALDAAPRGDAQLPAPEAPRSINRHAEGEPV